MKRGLGLLLCALLLLSGCRPAPVEETVPVTPSPVQAPEPTPEPTPALEPWQRAYIQLLQEDNRESREKAREVKSGYPSLEEYYSLYDMDRDGLPELLLHYWELGSYYVEIYACLESDAVLLGSFCEGKEAIFLYDCPGEPAVVNSIILYSPQGTDYLWRKFTLTDGVLAEEELLDEFIPWEDAYAHTQVQDLVSGAQTIPVTRISKGEETDFRPILNYLPSPTSWQAAYRDILLYPGKSEELYALSEEDMDWLREVWGEQNKAYVFSLCDLDGDDVPELLLGYGKREYSDLPPLLLNILRWNQETEAVEDLDGPRTYGLIDTLDFFENGYFSTMNGVSSLYTIFWKLEDDIPNHYWSGFQRPWMAGEEPRPEDIVFEDSQTGEGWSWDMFCSLTGARTIQPTFQELTEENIQAAFWPSDGEEIP